MVGEDPHDSTEADKTQGFGHSLKPDIQLIRDVTNTLTVIDKSLCPSSAGKVWRFEYALPDLRTPLPTNLTLFAFNFASEGVYVRAAISVHTAVTRTVSLWRGGRLVRVDFGSNGLPFHNGDCFGWAHSKGQGLAFAEKPENIQVELVPVPSRTTDVSTIRHLGAYQNKFRTYSVRFSVKYCTDPFGCWTKVRLGTKSMSVADSLFNTRSQLHCCYSSPLQAKTQEVMSCFGVTDGATRSVGHTWFHPSHCCKQLPLPEAMIASIRCEAAPAQLAWRNVLHQASQCLLLCCAGKHLVCSAARLLFTRRSSVSHHRRRIGGRRLRQRDGISTVADCPAAAAVLGLLHDTKIFKTKSVSSEWRLHDVGSQHNKICAIYGYDTAECCLHHACQGHPKECASCLLSEVPWGAWSLPQRTIIAHTVRQLQGVTMPPSSGFPSTLQNALKKLLVKHSAPYSHAQVHVQLFESLVAVLLQALKMRQQSHLYEALVALQVAVPMELVNPMTIVDVLDKLPQQSYRNEAEPEYVCIEAPKHSGMNKSPLSEKCGLAGASLYTIFLGGPAQRCCPTDAWQALVRAAAEGNYWISAVFAMCILCELAPGWQHNRLMEAVSIVDEYLACSSAHDCFWHTMECGKGVWSAIFDHLRFQTTCTLRVSIAAQATKLPLRLHVRTHSETMAFLRQGGSIVRMNDGEQLMIHPQYNGPLTRMTDTMIRMRFVAAATCPGLCIGLLNPQNDSAMRSIGPTHYTWWTKRGFRLTRALFDDGIFPSDSRYCFGLVTYRPKFGADKMSRQQFAKEWDSVFANRNVLLVSPLDTMFSTRCGGCVPISYWLYGQGKRVAPFRRAHRVAAMNPNFISYSHVTGVEFGRVISNVRTAAAEAQADTVAVTWGPFADILVAELACRGLRALDIGNLFSILQVGWMANSTDPDDV